MHVSRQKVDSRSWWSELWDVWRDTRLIVLTAQIAAIYAAILIPFKAGVPIIPGFVELRPANAIPLVASLLFGPPAAWGAGIGNIIGDCFGTLGPASLFGFLGNFFLGYLPYFFREKLGKLSFRQPLDLKSWWWWVQFGCMCLISSGVCAGVIGWGVEWLGLLPFEILAPAIFFNNVVMGLVLAPPLLAFLDPRVKRWHLRYRDIRSSYPMGDSPRKTDSPVQNLESGKQEDETPPLVCEHLSFQYPETSTPVLKNISLSITAGEIIVLLGKSGSGKSTLCYTFNGLIPQFVGGPYSGEVRISGQRVIEDPVWKQAGRIGLVFQDFDSQIVGTTVQGELIHPLEYRHPPLNHDEITQRMEKALLQVGLEGMLARDPLTLSGGQRQRLVLASVLVQQPGIVVLDEPTSDLDPGWRKQLREVFRHIRDEGISLFITEHEYEALDHADRVLVLEGGEIVWEGTPDTLFRQPTLMKSYGLQPFSLAEIFEGLTHEPLPVSVEDSWALTDRLGYTIEPPAAVLDDTIRLGLSERRPQNRDSLLIDMQQVSFQYGPHAVLEDCSLSVFEGDFLAILGPNGSGKSTLVRLLNGLLLPTTGRVMVDGLETSSTPIGELAQRVGLVFQNPDHQIFADTVWEEVAFSLKNLGFASAEVQERVTTALHAVGLPVDVYRSLDPFTLRKGERQRVAVASVLATRPKILIFDEPTTGLDAHETERIMAMIRSLSREGHTIVMITHSMKLVAEYAQQCILMKDGKIIKTAMPRDLFSDLEGMREVFLEVPAVARFSQRWGCTLLTVPEVKASLLPKKSM